MEVPPVIKYVVLVLFVLAVAAVGGYYTVQDVRDRESCQKANNYSVIMGTHHYQDC